MQRPQSPNTQTRKHSFDVLCVQTQCQQSRRAEAVRLQGFAETCSWSRSAVRSRSRRGRQWWGSGRTSLAVMLQSAGQSHRRRAFGGRYVSYLVDDATPARLSTRRTAHAPSHDVKPWRLGPPKRRFAALPCEVGVDGSGLWIVLSGEGANAGTHVSPTPPS